jgi:hypothetical protein
VTSYPWVQAWLMQEYPTVTAGDVDRFIAKRRSWELGILEQALREMNETVLQAGEPGDDAVDLDALCGG